VHTVLGMVNGHVYDLVSRKKKEKEKYYDQKKRHRKFHTPGVDRGLPQMVSHLLCAQKHSEKNTVEKHSKNHF